MHTTRKQCQTFFMYLLQMDDDQYTRITLRIPKTLHADLMRHAYTTSKSNNAEIIGRLQASFEATTPPLPKAVQSAVEREVARNGGTHEDALVRLVELGEQRSGMVLNLTVHKGMTVQDLSTALQGLAEALPAGTEVALRPSAE